MNITRKRLFVAIATALLAASMSGARADQPPTDNLYRLGSISPADLTRWQTLPGSEVTLSQDGLVDPYFVLKANFDISRANNRVHGIHRDGLNLPVPKAVRFMAYGRSPFLYAVLSDSYGHHITSTSPLPLKSEVWTQVVIPTSPDGQSSPLRNLDSIALMTMDGCGENLYSGRKTYLFSNFVLDYPPGVGPQNETFTAEDLANMLAPLDPAISRIENLIPQAKAAGAETRYFTVSLSVIKRYRNEVTDMLTSDDPLLAQHTAEYLLTLASDTERGLNAAIKDPNGTIRVPRVKLVNLKVREGAFYSGDRPVTLVGVCGWFDANRLQSFADSGFTVAAGETGIPFPAEDKVDTAPLADWRAKLEGAAKANIAVDFLLSPHYMPGWVYDKWPDVDPENRRANNPFMPWDIRSPHFRDILAKDVATVVPWVRDEPALLDYDLINEAWYRPFYNLDDATVAQYMATHPGVTKSNAVQAYTTDQVDQFFKWYAGIVHQADSKHIEYIKVLTSEDVQCVDREFVGDTLPANGMDSYPVYPDLTGDLAADFAWVLMRLDFHRTLTPDKPILDGEYHVYNGAYETPDNYIRTALWAAALHGKEAASLWVVDRADTVAVSWHANGMKVLGDTGLDFLRLGPEIHAFQRARSPLALFCDGPGAREAYQAALFQDLNISVITNKRIAAGFLKNVRVLILPGGSSLSADAARRVADFEKSGGVVVRCPEGVVAHDLFPSIRDAVGRAKLAPDVRVATYGVECRSVVLNGRKLFYVINYGRTACVLHPESKWNLRVLTDLRTRERIDGGAIPLESLQTRMFEAGGTLK